MKSIIIRAVAATSAFFIGTAAAATVLLDLNPLPPPSVTIPPVKINVECSVSKSFPGISRRISGVEKSKSGYFPKMEFSGKWEKRDDFINDWYGKHLRAMGEKSLLDARDESTEIYRFLWLRTFHHPIYVKIERRAGEIVLSTKELDGAGGYDPGKTLRSGQVAVSREDFCRFLNLLEQANFWTMSVQNDEIGFDGSQWILEGVREGRYHAVDRWTPSTGEYREACLYLLKLSGLSLDRLKDDLY